MPDSTGRAIELEEGSEAEIIESNEYIFDQIGSAVPISPSHSQFDTSTVPSQPLVVSEQHQLLFIAHTDGFLVAKTLDVIRFAKEIKERGTGPSLKELCVVDVCIGKVHILALSTDSKMLAACVGGDIHFYLVESLLNKEQTSHVSCSLDAPECVKDMRWKNKNEKSYIVLSNSGRLYHGVVGGSLEHVFDDVDAVEWSVNQSLVAMARKNVLRVLTHDFKETLSMSLCFDSWVDGADDDYSVKVDSIRWCRPDCIILGCLLVKADGTEENYLVQAISVKEGSFANTSTEPLVSSFSELFTGITDDIVPSGKGPHLFLCYLRQCELGIIANKKNVDQHINLITWLTGDLNSEIALIYFSRDKWAPRIPLQDDGDDNVVVGLSLDGVSMNEKVRFQKGVDDPKDLSPYCIMFCLTLEGKLIMFHLASILDNPTRHQDTMLPDEETTGAASDVRPDQLKLDPEIKQPAPTGSISLGPEENDTNNSKMRIPSQLKVDPEAKQPTLNGPVLRFPSQEVNNYDQLQAEKSEGIKRNETSDSTMRIPDQLKVDPDAKQQQLKGSFLSFQSQGASKNDLFQVERSEVPKRDDTSDSVTRIPDQLKVDPDTKHQQHKGSLLNFQSQGVSKNNLFQIERSEVPKRNDTSDSMTRIPDQLKVDPDTKQQQLKGPFLNFQSQGVSKNNPFQKERNEVPKRNDTNDLTMRIRDQLKVDPETKQQILKESVIRFQSQEVSNIDQLRMQRSEGPKRNNSSDTNMRIPDNGVRSESANKGTKPLPLELPTDASLSKGSANIKEMTEQLDTLLKDLEGMGGFADSSTGQRNTAEALSQGLEALACKCKTWKAIVKEHQEEIQDLLNKTVQVLARKTYLESIVKLATDTQYWDLWDRQGLGFELEMKHRNIIKIHQDLTNQLIQLEMHFNNMELNKFGKKDRAYDNSKGLQNRLREPRHIQSLNSLQTTMNSQLVVAEQLSQSLSEQMALLNVDSPCSKQQNVKRDLFKTIGLPLDDAASFNSPGYSSFEKRAAPLSSSVQILPKRNQTTGKKNPEPETARRRRESLGRSWVDFEPLKTTVRRSPLPEGRKPDIGKPSESVPPTISFTPSLGDYMPQGAQNRSSEEVKPQFSGFGASVSHTSGFSLKLKDAAVSEPKVQKEEKSNEQSSFGGIANVGVSVSPKSVFSSKLEAAAESEKNIQKERKLGEPTSFGGFANVGASASPISGFSLKLKGAEVSEQIVKEEVKLSEPSTFSGTVNAEPNSMPKSQLEQTLPTFNGIASTEKAEASSNADYQEDEMEEQAPEVSPVTELSLGNLGGFGLGSTPTQGSATPSRNPFGGSLDNSSASPVSSPFFKPSSGSEMFRPASFSFAPTQPQQQQAPSQPTTAVGGFGSSATPVGFGFAANQAPSGGGFGQPAQVGQGQQALGSALGSFGQSRQIGFGQPANNFAPTNGFGGGFGGNQSAGGFANVAPKSGGFASLASNSGGFAAAASATSGGFATPRGFAGAAAPVGGSGFGGFAGASGSGAGFGAAGGTGFGQKGSSLSAFGGTGAQPPAQLFTQMRK